MEEINNKFAIGEKLYRTICKKCWNSDIFKNKLIKKPFQTIKEVCGEEFNLNGNLHKIRVEDQMNPNIIFINIPPKRVADVSLTNEQLDNISGGVPPLFVLSVLVFSSGVSWGFLEAIGA